MTPAATEKVLLLACYFQNRACELEEIIELFCMDAEAAQSVQPMYLHDVNTEKLTQALAWMGAMGPVSAESYLGDMAQYVNYLTAAVMHHKQGSETLTKAQPVQPTPFTTDDFSAIRAQLCEAHPGDWLHHYGPAVEAEVLRRLAPGYVVAAA